MARRRIVISCVCFLILFGLYQTDHALALDVDQQPTVSIPTVTGTPAGPFIVVYSDPEQQINVRSGPGTSYEKVGILLNRQEVPAIGKIASGTWVKILYPGVPGGEAWVYSNLVRVFGDLPITEPPPTPTLRITSTIDATMASQYIVEIPPTRLPTYTPPPPLIIPTFPAVGENNEGTGKIPMGLAILSLGMGGLFGLVVSIIRRR